MKHESRIMDENKDVSKSSLNSLFVIRDSTPYYGMKDLIKSIIFFGALPILIDGIPGICILKLDVDSTPIIAPYTARPITGANGVS